MELFIYFTWNIFLLSFWLEWFTLSAGFFCLICTWSELTCCIKQLPPTFVALNYNISHISQGKVAWLYLIQSWWVRCVGWRWCHRSGFHGWWEGHMSGENWSTEKKTSTHMKTNLIRKGLFLCLMHISVSKPYKRLHNVWKGETNLRADRICVHHLFQACGTKHLIRALTSWFPIWSNYDLHMWLYTQYICTSFLHFANSQMLIKASIKLFILTLERLNLFNAVITGQTFIYRYYI